ncbi:MAG: AAA family ATPase [Nevskiaceae bacterium]|nr:MAG: AAA family ATPase [Nevskiaceae bacterium]
MTNLSRRAAASSDRKRQTTSNSQFTVDDTKPFPTPRMRTYPNINPAAGPLASLGAFGTLEWKAYKEDWLEAARFRRGVRAAKAERDRSDLLAEHALISTTEVDRTKGSRWKPGDGFASLRRTVKKSPLDEADDEDREEVPASCPRQFPLYPVTPAKVAARLILARIVDARPTLRDALRDRSPVVTIDVPDSEMLDRVLDTWQRTILDECTRVHKVCNNVGKRQDSDLLHIVAKEPRKGKAEHDREREALAAISLALPIVAISPAAETHLPKILLKSDPTRISFPPLDAITIARCIRIVTGRACRELLKEDTASIMTASDLIVAVRFDRSPAECMEELRRLAAAKRNLKSGRSIVMNDLHGMDEAVKWARELRMDLDAWRRGELSWSALSAGVCLVGPPGTGKTLFAQTLSSFLSNGSKHVPLVECSLSQWQGADDGHLGHLLRAMRRDFEQARAGLPSVLFIDEIDSFADRSKIKHVHSDYVVEVVNGLLAQLDGAISREGIICVGATNDIGRCDPAILRPGRLGKIIRINLPNERELERMFRVRLNGRLDRMDLSEICMLALGSTGAEVERITNDALRSARHAGRDVALSDLHAAIAGNDDRTVVDLEIAAVHEAGHMVSEIELFGDASNVHANIAAIGARGGYTTRTKAPFFSGTYNDYARRLQVLFAGRVAEKLLLGEASHGAGGRKGSDLQIAASLAAGMCASLGIAGQSKLLYLGEVDSTGELLSYPEVRAAVNLELIKAEKAVHALLSKRKKALRGIASKLLVDKRIDGSQAEAIIRGVKAEKTGRHYAPPQQR